MLVLFGDNLERRGYGGQAAECRDCPNTVGVPTKKAPTMQENAFFKNDDYDSVFPAIRTAFSLARQHLYRGYDVAIPSLGLGTGRARLLEKAPRIFKLITSEIEELEVIAMVVIEVPNLLVV